jgi:hypothetical protein
MPGHYWHWPVDGTSALTAVLRRYNVGNMLKAHHRFVARAMLPARPGGHPVLPPHSQISSALMCR